MMPANTRSRLSIFFIFFFASCPGYATDEQRVIAFDLVSPEMLSEGEEARLDLHIEIAHPWYIYAPTEHNASLGLIGTKLTFSSSPYVQFSKAEFPEPTEKYGLHLLEGPSIEILQNIRVRPGVSAREVSFAVEVLYQLCKPDLCLPPTKETLSASIRIR